MTSPILEVFSAYEGKAMIADRRSQVTTLLEEIRAGHPDAATRLFEAVYDELRRIAGGLMRREREDHTLQPTELVNEAAVRLLEGGVLGRAPDRRYFFAAAVRAMRRILVEHARARATDKRGGGQEHLPLDAALGFYAQQNLDVVAVHEALEHLATLNERQSQMVELRFFGRYTNVEIADLLEVSLSTVESDLRQATAFLHGRLREP
jgi:RNA polymerase sigma factor (TIGR02999 family)